VTSKGGRRTTGVSGTGNRPRGLCPVCRSMQLLIFGTGKLGAHGKSAATPRGCAGRGESPLRRTAGLPEGKGATVVGMRAGEDGPTAREPGVPEVRVELRPEALTDQAYARRLATDPGLRGGGGDVG